LFLLQFIALLLIAAFHKTSLYLEVERETVLCELYNEEAVRIFFAYAFGFFSIQAITFEACWKIGEQGEVLAVPLFNVQSFVIHHSQ